MRRAWIGVWLAWTSMGMGCDQRERYEASSPSVWVGPGEAVAYEAVGAVGPAPVTAWVRAVNDFGASVASASAEVVVGGTPQTVNFDNVGYASLTLESVGRVTVTGVTEATDIYVHAGDYTPEGMVRVGLAPVEVDGLAARVPGGAVGVSGQELWWSDDAGHRAHRVLDAGGPILGLKVGHADVDDLEDVLVWTDSTVFLLRSRTGGGMAWGGALQASGYTVGGVGLGDLSGDNIPDMAVAWSNGQTGLIETWHGDGVFGFQRMEPRELALDPVSLLVADSTGEGQPQVTLLFSDGTWGRYIEGAPGRLMPIGPATPQSIAPLPGWVLEKALDIDGDGLDEIPVSTPYNPLVSQRSMLFYNLAGDALTALPLDNEPSPWVAVGDGNGDFMDDIWLHRGDGSVQVVFHESTAFGPIYPREVVVQQSPDRGPLDIADIDDDGDNDLWIATPDLWWAMRGRGIPFDNERFWEPREPEDTFVREDVVGPVRFVELDGNASTREFVIGTNGEELELSVLTYLGNDERADRTGRTPLTGAELVDIEVCGTNAYALTNSTLHVVSVTDGQARITAEASVSDPRDVACGNAPGGVVAAVAAGGEVISYSGSLGEVGREPTDAYGLAFGDLDGTGSQVHSCQTEDCALVVWPTAAGTTGLFVLDPFTATWVDAAGTETPLRGFGDSVRLRDLDGDGVREGIGHDERTGVVSIFRQVGDGLAPAHLWQCASPWLGGLDVNDADGDGDIDFWGIDAAGALRYTHEEREDPPATVRAPRPDHGRPLPGVSSPAEVDTGRWGAAVDTGALAPKDGS